MEYCYTSYQVICTFYEFEYIRIHKIKHEHFLTITKIIDKRGFVEPVLLYGRWNEYIQTLAGDAWLRHCTLHQAQNNALNNNKL